MINQYGYLLDGYNAAVKFGPVQVLYTFCSVLARRHRNVTVTSGAGSPRVCHYLCADDFPVLGEDLFQVSRAGTRG